MEMKEKTGKERYIYHFYTTNHHPKSELFLLIFTIFLSVFFLSFILLLVVDISGCFCYITSFFGTYQTLAYFVFIFRFERWKISYSYFFFFALFSFLVWWTFCSYFFCILSCLKTNTIFTTKISHHRKAFDVHISSLINLWRKKIVGVARFLLTCRLILMMLRVVLFFLAFFVLLHKAVAVKKIFLCCILKLILWLNFIRLAAFSSFVFISLGHTNASTEWVAFFSFLESKHIKIFLDNLKIYNRNKVWTICSQYLVRRKHLCAP